MCVLANLEYLSILFCAVFWAAASGLVAVLPILLNVVYCSWSVCLSSCLFVTAMSCAKVAESIEMQFGNADSGCPRNHAFGGGLDPL